MRAAVLGFAIVSLISGLADAQSRQDGRFEGNEYYGDSGEGFFGDPSSGHHGMPLFEPDEPPRSYRVAKRSELPYLKVEDAQIIEFNPDMYGD